MKRIVQVAQTSQQQQQSLALAPALVETYSRLLVYMEIELLGIKGFISMYNKWSIDLPTLKHAVALKTSLMLPERSFNCLNTNCLTSKIFLYYFQVNFYQQFWRASRGASYTRYLKCSVIDYIIFSLTIVLIYCLICILC